MSEIVETEVPEFLEESSEYDTRYKRTMKWDPAAGDFVRDPANRVLECPGEEGFMVWCLKTALTERWSCAAYPDEIGAEMEDAMDDDDPEIVETQVEQTITEALLVNPRTESVGNFVFEWDGDELHCTFDVKGAEWDGEFQISI